MKDNGVWSKEVFANNLRYYMNKAEKNQKEMAKIAGVSAPAFSEWLNAKKYPRIDKIEILANYFGILKSDLIEDKTQKNSPPVKLTEGEMAILELFRKVPESNQRMVLDMIRIVLNSKE